MPTLQNFTEIIKLWTLSGDDSVSNLGIRAYVSVANNGISYDGDASYSDTLKVLSLRILIQKLSPKELQCMFR